MTDRVAGPHGASWSPAAPSPVSIAPPGVMPTYRQEPLVIPPGCHLYQTPAGGWRAAAPGDRFFTVRGPSEALRQVQADVHGVPGAAGHDRSDEIRSFLRRAVEPAAGTDAQPPVEPCAAGARTVQIEGDNPIAEQLAILVEPHARVTTGPLDDPAVTAADIVVSVAGWLPDARWLALDQLCVRHTTPRHSVYLEGDAVVIGPLYRPGATASYSDVRGRRLAASSSPDELLALWAYLDGEQPKPPAPWPVIPWAVVAAGIVAADVLAVLAGTQGPTEGFQVLVRPATAEVARHRVLPLPTFTSLSARS